MDKNKYCITLGFEHPNSGHWLSAGQIIEMTEGEATQLVLSGYLTEKPEEQKKKGK